MKLLARSCTAFDNGHHDEAVHIATELRVLLHDARPNSTSLAHQVGIKEHMTWFDTSGPPAPSNLMSHHGLVGVSGSGMYVPRLAGGAEPLPPMLEELIGNGAPQWIAFDEWWGTVVFDDLESSRLTRKDLVLFTANTDLGAHADESIDESLYRLTREQSLGWGYVRGGEEIKMNNATWAGLRQVAYEVIESVTRHHPELLAG